MPSRVLVALGVLGAGCALLPVLIAPYAFQIVSEGTVGLLWFGGKLTEEVKAPGFHFVIPVLQELTEVPITVTMTEVTNVECGTSGGVTAQFPSVEVVHRLDRGRVLRTMREHPDYKNTWIVGLVRLNLNKICSRHTLHEIFIDKFDQLDEILKAMMQETLKEWVPGLELIAVRMSKPDIPQRLLSDFVRVESEVARLKTAVQHHHLVLRQAETERSRQVLNAEKEREIANMTMVRELEEVESSLQIQKLQNEMYVARTKDHADASTYTKLREADANKRRLTPTYLDLLRQQALFRNLEVHYGDRVPDYIVDNKGEGAATRAVLRERVEWA